MSLNSPMYLYTVPNQPATNHRTAVFACTRLLAKKVKMSFSRPAEPFLVYILCIRKSSPN